MNEPLEPAPQAAPTATKKAIGAARELLETLVIALVFFAALQFVVKNFRVEGDSMLPNFHDRQFLLVDKISYRFSEPRRGDVIVFRYPRDPDEDFVKRILALPGETIEITDGAITINGSPITESYPLGGPTLTYRPLKVTLGEDQYFMMGDNRNYSSDSRRLANHGILPAGRADPDLSPAESHAGRGSVLRDGRQPQLQQRLAGLGPHQSARHHRAGLALLLASVQMGPLPPAVVSVGEAPCRGKAFGRNISPSGKTPLPNALPLQNVLPPPVALPPSRCYNVRRLGKESSVAPAVDCFVGDGRSTERFHSAWGREGGIRVCPGSFYLNVGAKHLEVATRYDARPLLQMLRPYPALSARGETCEKYTLMRLPQPWSASAWRPTTFSVTMSWRPCGRL